MSEESWFLRTEENAKETTKAQIPSDNAISVGVRLMMSREVHSLAVIGEEEGEGEGEELLHNPCRYLGPLPLRNLVLPSLHHDL